MPLDTLATRGYSNTLGNNHRFNARIEWKISENQNLMIRPGFSYQANDPYSWTRGWQYGAPADGGSGYSYTNNLEDATRQGYNARLSAVYRAKLGKAGRTITLDGSANYSSRTDDADSYSNVLPTSDIRPEVDPETGEWNPDDYMRLRYLRDEAPSSSYRLRANFTYTEPISKISQLSLQYRFKYDFQERDKRSYAGYTPGELEFDSDLSNSYESGYQTHAVGPGFRLAKERNTLVANVYYQRSMLDGQVIHGQSDKISHGYDNVTYFLMGQFNFNRENSLRMFISSYTDNPRITSLQNVPDVTDAQNITNGNPDLNPSYNHRIRLHYVNSNVTKGRTFMWMFMMNATQDYNATHMVASPGTITLNGQSYTPNYYSRPVNMDGYWNLRTHLSYGFPIGFLKSNFNVMAGLTYTLTPSMLGGVVQNDGSITGGSRNDTSTIGYDFNAVLGSNISENVDFTLGWSGTYSEATNSLVEGARRTATSTTRPLAT